MLLASLPRPTADRAARLLLALAAAALAASAPPLTAQARYPDPASACSRTASRTDRQRLDQKRFDTLLRR